MKKNLKRHDKNKDALERLSGRIWDRRLFNGYVVEPVPIVVLYAIVFFVLLGMTTLFLISTATFDYPSDLETKLFQVNTIKLEDDKTNDDTEVYFETNAGTLSVKKSFFHDFDQIITEFNPGDTFYITISKEEPLSIWGLYSNRAKPV